MPRGRRGARHSSPHTSPLFCVPSTDIHHRYTPPLHPTTNMVKFSCPEALGLKNTCYNCHKVASETDCNNSYFTVKEPGCGATKKPLPAPPPGWTQTHPLRSPTYCLTETCQDGRTFTPTAQKTCYQTCMWNASGGYCESSDSRQSSISPSSIDVTGVYTNPPSMVSQWEQGAAVPV